MAASALEACGDRHLQLAAALLRRATVKAQSLEPIEVAPDEGRTGL